MSSSSSTKEKHEDDERASAKTTEGGHHVMTIPMWRTGSFVGEFGDAYVQDTELEGGQVAPAIDQVVDIMNEVLKKRRNELKDFDEGDIEKVRHREVVMSGDFIS